MITTASERVIALSPVELLACWEALHLGDPPYQLRLRSPSGPLAAQQETRRVLTRALVKLAARGLSDGTHPHPELAAMLRVLAHPSHQLDIRCTGPAQDPRIGLGPITNTSGLLVTTIDDGTSPIELRPMDSSQIPGALLSLLGPITAGTAPTVNIPTEIFDQARRAVPANASMRDLGDALTDRGIDPRDSSALARMTTSLKFSGQLGVSTWREGREHRGPWVVGFVRNDTGETFLQLCRQGTITMGPADATRLHRQWRELIEHTL